MTSAEYLAEWPEEGREQLARVLRRVMMQAHELRQEHRLTAGNGPSCANRTPEGVRVATHPSIVAQEAAQ